MSFVTQSKVNQKKRLSGRTEFYNSKVIDRKIADAKTGSTFLTTRGLAAVVMAKIAKGKQGIDKFSRKDLEEIISLDKNNFAISFAGRDEL